MHAGLWLPIVGTLLLGSAAYLALPRGTYNALGRRRKCSTSGQDGIKLGMIEGEGHPDYDCIVRQPPFPFHDGRRADLPRETGQGVLLDARAVFAEMEAEILARWGAEYESSLFTGVMAFSDGGKAVEDKVINAVLRQGGFLAAFTGISITAGHDCLFEESYPVLLNVTLGRLMAATGVRFEAINVAMGNTRPSPYSYCVDAHAGIDADIISWEMSMEVPDRKCGVAAASVELFVRSASVLPRRPAVLLMDASPDVGEKMCASKGRWRNFERRNQLIQGACDQETEKSLMNVYREYGLHHMFPASSLLKIACGDERFSRERLYQEGKSYPKPMSWHPAPAGHLLVADMLLMHYAKVILNALERLDAVAPGVTASDLRRSSHASVVALGQSLGLWTDGEASCKATGTAAEGGLAEPPLGGGRGTVLPRATWCNGWRFCDGAGDYRCASTYFPLAGGRGSHLLGMVTEPVLNRKGKALQVTPSTGMWALTLNEEKKPIFDLLETTPPDGRHFPRDMKWVLVGNKESGPISFEFNTVGVRSSEKKFSSRDGVNTNDSLAREQSMVLKTDPRIVVCKPDFISRVELGDEEGIRYTVDGEDTFVVETLAHPGLHRGSCVLLAAEIGLGRHQLAIEPLRGGKELVAISHVIYPA